MDHFQLITPFSPDALFAVYGKHCHTFEQSVLNFMHKKVQGYTGGLYSLRQYANGAYAMALDYEATVSVQGTYEDHQLSMEGASLLANLVVSHQLCEVLYEQGDEAGNNLFYNLHHALLQALKGRATFALDMSDPSQEGAISPEKAEAIRIGGPHKDLAEIERYLD